MWAQIYFRSWVREISGAPIRACILGDTLRGFMILRGSRKGVVAGFEAVARVGMRTMRRLAGANLREEDGVEKGGLVNDGVSLEKKAEVLEEEMKLVVAKGRCRGGEVHNG
ncbi:hypothetical protein EV1_012671 [Malus domestica]